MASEDNHSLRNLASSKWRFTRSTVNLRETASLSISGPSSDQNKAPKLARASSKMSLFNLFSRPKVERARGHTEVGLAIPMRPQTPPKPTVSSKSALRQNPSPSAQQSVRSRSSLMFRPMSMKPLPPDTDSGHWEPPPLFQAFPQSVKHATVQACVFPPEVLMRTQSQRRQAELIRERLDSARDLSIIEENSTETKKLEKSHKRLISNSVLNPVAPELINKIYILVTSGYIMQYAGDGPFDRLPEKVLKLGKDSAAFACDLIPGKHWVLQISSHAHDDGTIEMGPKSTLLSRLRTQNAIGKRAATSFLLVLESAEEMDAWMTTVRKEIENNGGQRAKDESTRASSSIDGSSGKQSIETSHRYLVQRDPNVITKIAPVDSPHQSYHAVPLKVVTLESEGNRTERTPSIASSTRDQSSRQSIKRQSAEVPSASSTPISQDQMQFDQSRGRSRFSYMSSATSASGTGTRNTSRDSSPVPQSPLVEVFAPVAETESFRPFRSLHSNPSSDTGFRRRSVQPLPVTNEDNSTSVEAPATRQRHSFYGPTSPKLQEDQIPEPEFIPHAAVEKVPTPAPPFVAAKGLTAHIASQTRSVSSQSNPEKSDQAAASVGVKDREDSPVRFNSGGNADAVTVLQQTRVSTVIPYFKNWIEKWPTVQDLAEAKHDEVLAAWKGLGYYSRATRLHEGAKAVVSKPSQMMPNEVSGLLQLPGIGQYTAGAISSIAFGRAEPVLDGNVARVLSRQLGLYFDVKDKRSSDLLWKVADELIKKVSNHPEVEFSAIPGQWNQALMELGSTICTPRSKCEECPIQKTCRAYSEGVALSKSRQSKTSVPDIEDVCTFCDQLDTEDLATIPEEEMSDKDVKPTKKRKTVTKQSNTLSRYFAIGTPSASSNVDTEDEEAASESKKRKAPITTGVSKSVNTYCSLFPKKTAKKKVKEEDCVVCLIELRVSNEESKWLIEQRPATGLLASLWQFPQTMLSDSDTTAAHRKTSAQKYLSSLIAGGVDLGKARYVTSFDPLLHVFTHLKLTMHAYHYRITDKTEADSLVCDGTPARKWVSTNSMDNETLSTGMRKCWELVAGSV
ncbi:hypothetical protein N0V95_002286 [Ascochyta clinopodiicola]|nr:hypothetical protein N0V95_002286 [Ascochyta clinopodiicola]